MNEIITVKDLKDLADETLELVDYLREVAATCSILLSRVRDLERRAHLLENK